MFKESPSEEYLNNIGYYKKMHVEGYKLINGSKRKPEESYDEKSTKNFAFLIKEIIEINKIENMLDYGCGKAIYYKKSFDLNNNKISSLSNLWNIEINLYDPCFLEYSVFPQNKKFDLTICIDVLEHIPDQDIEWVLYKIFKVTNKYVFINVACHDAIALLPNGKNAHINVKNPEWWHEKILNLKKIFKNLKIICLCSLKKEGKLTYFPLQYDDKLINYKTK